MLAAETRATPALAPLTDAALLVPFLDPALAPDQALTQATRLLTTFGGLLGRERATPGDLRTGGALTAAQAAQLAAALALARRLVQAERPAPHYVRSPADLGPLLRAELRPLEQEVFRVILLGTDGALLRMVDLYAGTHQSTALSVAEVFREPIRAGADRIILAHNHPSSSMVISADDVTSTQQLIRAGQLLDIPVEDHLVIGQTWVSLRQLGLCDWP